MRIIRYMDSSQVRLAAVTDEETAYPLPDRDVLDMMRNAEELGVGLLPYVEERIRGVEPLAERWERLPLLTPFDAPEVWAAGVTYERSREARNYEATQGRMDRETIYDKVYVAERPEIFFKSTARRTVGPHMEVSLRSDSRWQVPEPELGLVLGRRGNIVGYTVGNDMSCRDIEGENPLYLPQAKIWRASCALGPALRLAETVADPYKLTITCTIYRGGAKVFEGSTGTDKLKRRLDELVSFLARDNDLFDGTVLLTGTCIVPPNEFTLQSGDRIEIDITGIGTLVNSVR